MLTIDINNLYMEYGERKLFFIKSQQIYSNDKIGIIGENGAGKTTLLDILANKTTPVKGSVKLNKDFCYIEQLNASFDYATDDQVKYKWGIVENPQSGGEVMRDRIAKGLSERAGILLCDEPTSNLDSKAINLLEKALYNYDGTVILVSHDRKLMDKICNQIWEIKDGSVNVFNGNYSDYIDQKEKERLNQQKEYDKYASDKKRLTKAMEDRNRKASSMTKTPKRMGNSEARLHKMDVRQRAGKVSQTAKQIKGRLERLEVKVKPKEEASFKMTSKVNLKKCSKTAIRVNDLSFAYDKNIILDKVSCNISRGDKVAILGENGSGKTTLLNCIANESEGVIISPNYEIGYFQQNCLNLKKDMTILETVLEKSVFPEHMARIVLGRLGIRREDVYKKIDVLSGGERCKILLATLICRGCSILILDEPTNYLDIYVLEALENMLIEYDGTLILVSHDRYFVDKVATKKLVVKDKKIIEENILIKKKSSNKESEILLLEFKKLELLNQLNSQISEEKKEEIEEEYNSVCAKLASLKK